VADPACLLVPRSRGALDARRVPPFPDAAALPVSLRRLTEDPFQKVLAQSLVDGGVKVLKGSPEQSFFHDYFDPPQATFQALALR
jgi:hypothetical protein